MPPQRPRAARFDEVDTAGAAAQIDYLDRQAATSFWQARKRQSLELLALRPGMTVLDVGCGTGAEVRAIAARVAPGGSAVGVDASRALIAEARSRTSTDEAATFRVADAHELTFEVESFDAVRVERTLQHLADPRRALAEIVRVARPGAAVVAVEPDWDTLTIDGEPFEVTLSVCRRWADAIRQPRIGRELPALLVAAGLERVDVRADTSTISDLAFAAEQFALPELARAAAEAADVSSSEADAWLADLRDREQDGRFSASVTYVTARGFVPVERALPVS